MDLILKVSEFFLLSLALGVGMFTFLIDTNAAGAGVMKLFSSLCAAAAFLASLFQAVAGEPLSASAISYYVATLSFVLIYLFHKDKKSILMWVLFAIHTLTLIGGIYFFQTTGWTEFFYLLSSSILLGAITFAMTLGHWYLVTPKLSEAPLKWAVIFTWAILAVKVVWTTLFVSNNMDYFTNFTELGAGYSFNWLMLLMRVGWGYVVIFIMSVFSWKLVNMRSIQSATGMFYAMVFFVLTGELVATYIYYKYGMLL